MKDPFASPLLRRTLFALPGIVAVVVCSHSLLAYGHYVRSRVFEPYAIKWLEPLFFRSALAFYMNEPLYGPPNLDYTAPIYSPGLAILGGLMFKVAGPSLPLLRQFSFLMFGCLAILIAVWSYLESRDVSWSIVSFTLTLALSSAVRYCTTAVNVDAPCAFFSALAVYLVHRHDRSRWATVASALCVVIAFMFKQPACLLGPALVFYLWTCDRKRALLFLVVCVSTSAALIAALMFVSHGWYWTYAFTTPMTSPHKDNPKFFHTMMKHFQVGALAVWGAVPLLTWLSDSRRRWFWACLWASTLGMACLSFRKQGGDRNVLLPALWFGVLAFSLLPPLLMRLASNHAQRWAAQVFFLTIAVSSLHYQFDHVRHRCLELMRVQLDKGADGPTYPQYAAFERKLWREITSVSGPVFVGARFLDLSRPLNTHQTGLKEIACRTRLFDLAQVVKAAGGVEHRYRKMIVWHVPRCMAFVKAVGKYYKKVKEVGVDPLIGLRVFAYEPKASR